MTSRKIKSTIQNNIVDKLNSLKVFRQDKTRQDKTRQDKTRQDCYGLYCLY